MDNLLNVLKLFKTIPRNGVIAFFNDEKKYVFVTYYIDFNKVLEDLNLEDFTRIEILERNVPYIYGRNFFLKYYYKYFYKQGYTIYKPNKYLPGYRCVIRLNKNTGNYAVLLTNIGNEGKKMELLGYTPDPLEGIECMKLFDEHKAPFCLWNNNTKRVAINNFNNNGYDVRILKGLDRFA